MRRLAVAAGVLVVCVPLSGAVLPEDRADVLYHRYHGGGVTIDGPSISVRKQVSDDVSVSGKYYVDSISSASIDVVTTASPYQEERKEYSLGVDYLHDKSTFSGGYTLSSENDYEAATTYFNISQDMFGDLTTISLGYSMGSDNVYRMGGSGGSRQRVSGFEESVTRRDYSVGLSQILTKDLVVNLDFETITDEGYLHNPYRSVRYLDGGSYLFQSEVYPGTHTSRAAALRAMYYLPYRAVVRAEYRLYSDTWGVNANTFQLSYTHPWHDRWIFDGRVRSYRQTQADFYSDLFDRVDAQNYLARDKELSAFGSYSLGFTVSYDLFKGGWHFLDRGRINFSYDRIAFSYDNFRDLRVKGVTPGTEPLYSFSADVMQFYLSLWY